MATYFVCLANSMKEGGKCMAGIELNEELLPVMKKTAFLNGCGRYAIHRTVKFRIVSRHHLFYLIYCL